MARPGLTQHRKFRRLARVLGGQAIARGILELLWDPCYESGDDYVGTSDDVEDLVGWTGEPGILTRALLDAGKDDDSAGFIDEIADRPGRYRVHDLYDHAPKYVATRVKKEAERKERGESISSLRSKAGRKGARAKARKLLTTQKLSVGTNSSKRLANGQQTDSNDAAKVPTPALALAPALAPALARKSVSPATAECADAVPAGALLTFPTIGPMVKHWHLSHAQVADWQAAYPGVNVEAECRRALVWILANRPKTAQGMPRFLVKWLNRAADKPPSYQPERRGPRTDAPDMARAFEWRDECQRLHAGRCGNATFHVAKMEEERQ